METKFTNGEWCHDYEGAYHSVWSKEFNHPVAIVHNETDVVDFDESNANAHLIAAAPEMYEMLEYVMKCAAMQDNTLIDASKIRGLLAKARGESL